MPIAVLFGLGLICFAGTLMGGFTLPMRFAVRWPWEASWLVYSLSGLLVFPILTALVTLPRLSDIYLRSSTQSLVTTALFGFGWGIGSVLFGIGIDRLGMSVGFSIILGLTAALGSLIPMLVLAPGEIATTKGLLILVGLGIVLGGICLCGVASGIKARALPSANAQSVGKLRTGLIICVVSGMLASMLNLAMAFGEDITHSAIELGATSSKAPNSIWVLAVAFGAIANVGYCVWLLIRNRTSRAFRAPKSLSHWMMGVLMGGLWFGGVTIYGSGAAALGRWGAVLGWPLLMAMMIVTANVLGWLMGEWRTSPRKGRRTMIAGVAVLSMGICVIGYSGSV